MRTGRRFAALAVAVLAMLSSACGDSNPAATVSPSPTDNPTTTETFTGLLLPQSSNWHAFTASATGTMTATLTTVDPVVVVGVGVGTTPTSGCGVQVWNNASTTATTVTSPINPGLYCVTIYDVGNLTGSTAYTLTVTHP
jgi:hypothetical protein